MTSYDWTIDWNYENLTKLIKLYGREPALWDPLHSDYQVKEKKSDAWEFLAKEMGCEVIEVKSKMTSLLSSYRREKMKTKKSMDNAEGGEKIYKSKWFGYKFFAFLRDKETSSKNKKNVANEQKGISFNASGNVTDLCFNECITFGKYISAKIQKLNGQEKNFLMHRINNLIFEAEMELYSQKHDGYNSAVSSVSSTSEVTSEFNHIRSQPIESESLSHLHSLNHKFKESSSSNS